VRDRFARVGRLRCVGGIGGWGGCGGGASCIAFSMTVHVLSPTYQFFLEFSVRDLPDAVFLNGNQKMRPLINFAFDARRVSV
jgi:hypothetical protein